MNLAPSLPGTAVLQEDVGMATLYEIVVKGELGPTAASAFDGMRLEARDGETAIVGDVVDQAQLTGLLNRISDLGLPLVSVTPISETDLSEIGTAAPITGGPRI